MKKTILAVLIVLLLIVGFYIWFSDKSTNNGSYQNPPTNNDNQQATVTSVKVAVIATGDAGAKGPKIGCDDSVVFINRNVAATTMPLNAAFQELFSLNTEKPTDGSNTYYNVIYKMQTGDGKLKFDHATIESGVAKIYLTGAMSGLGGVCDSPRVPAQIEYTAKQFATVTSVETYLNNNKVDWTTFGSMK